MVRYWSKYFAVEALAAYADAVPSAHARVVTALRRHFAAFAQHLDHDLPAFDLSRWGFVRYSDALLGLEWLLDQGVTDPPLLALLLRIQRESDALMQQHAGWTWKEYGRF